MLKNKTRVLEM